MARTIYDNNDVCIEAKTIYGYETSIEIEGKNLIVISAIDELEFKRELSAVLDRYRI